MRQQKRILVAPLNWGLGHATRCIPIIREMQGHGIEVHLASDGRALDLLKREFPNLPFLDLPGYGIEYRSKNIIINVGREVPSLLRAVYLEHQFLEKYMARHDINGVISDNRMGCFSKKIPCVFITHQVDLLVPSRPLQWFSRQLNYRFIKKYNECWIPDVPGEPNLSGRLSHGTPLDGRVLYIGAISRMENFPMEKKYDAIAVLSGPEPQRSYFENAFIEQAKALPHRFLVVQGKPEQEAHFFIGENIEVTASLTSGALNRAILASGLFVGRSGYTSMMDLAKLGKPALLVPTPGQTEQEYLADLYARSGIFFSQKQAEFDLEKGMEAALKRGGLNSGFFQQEEMVRAVRDFLARC